MLAEVGAMSSSALAFGLVVGLRHSLEADHVAAVSTLATQRGSPLRGALVGGLWGLGHSISLMLAGVLVLLLQIRIAPRVELGLELVVALMLLALGGQTIWRLLRGDRLHLHTHSHGAHFQHVHPHLHGAGPEPEPHTHHGQRLGRRALLVGLVHGLAGSGALMLLVLSTISSPLLGFIYIVLFGLGSTGGMMLMGTLISIPAWLAGPRFQRAVVAVQVAAAVLSIGIGMEMSYQIGVVDGLLM